MPTNFIEIPEKESQDFRKQIDYWIRELEKKLAKT